MKMEEIEKKLKDFLSKQTDIEFALIFGSYLCTSCMKREST